MMLRNYRQLGFYYTYQELPSKCYVALFSQTFQALGRFRISLSTPKTNIYLEKPQPTLRCLREFQFSVKFEVSQFPRRATEANEKSQRFLFQQPFTARRLSRPPKILAQARTVDKGHLPAKTLRTVAVAAERQRLHLMTWRPDSKPPPARPSKSTRI